MIINNNCPIKLLGQSDDSYKADELLSLEDNKYMATLTINALKEEDVQKKIYFFAESK